MARYPLKKRKPRRGPKVAEYYRKYHYGMKHGTYDLLKERQKGCCAICGNETKLVVDHCHTSKQVRGLLCSLCNTGLGQFKDDPKILLKAVDYLNAHGKIAIGDNWMVTH